MSWLKNSSFPFNRQLSERAKLPDPRSSDYDTGACYQSFCKHWQQAYDIIRASQFYVMGPILAAFHLMLSVNAARGRHPGDTIIKPQSPTLHDDVLGVVNHLEHLATLLALEARAREVGVTTLASNPSPCLEHLLCENMLDKLYEWGCCTGKYINAVRLEQLKIYSLLVTHYGNQLLAAEPFLRPQLKLLAGCRNELPPVDVENRLVVLLGQLCVVLMQNMKYIDLFFLTANDDNGGQADFIIVSLLLCCVHREGGAGSRARDALLLCASMSAKCQPLAHYLLHSSNLCPVLATGLSGLYSLLPRSLGEASSGWHRLTPDDVTSVPKLELFIDSLEFCNAVAQVAHPSIKEQLLDFLYQGFLLPVMGPALLQSGCLERVAGTAYLELVVRCSCARGLLPAVLRFLLQHEYDGERVFAALWQRLPTAETQLALVTLGLVETLIDLNCEDVMLELVYKYLLNGGHIQGSQRNNITDGELYLEAADAFLTLTPACCFLDSQLLNDEQTVTRRLSEAGFDDRERRSSSGSKDQSIQMSSMVTETRINYGLNPNESLYGNYHACLCEARRKIKVCSEAVSNWTSQYENFYEGSKNMSIERNEESINGIVNEFQNEHANLFNNKTNENNSNDTIVQTNGYSSSREQNDSLPSIGESSGYESFKCQRTDTDFLVDEDDLCEGDDVKFAEDSFVKLSLSPKFNDEFETTIVPNINGVNSFSRDGTISPLLAGLIEQVGALLDCDIYVALRVTGLLSRLAVFPTSILASVLLCPSIELKTGNNSLFQVISNLKQEIEEVTSKHTDTPRLVAEARAFLVWRELALANARRNAVAQSHNTHTRGEVSGGNTRTVHSATTSFTGPSETSSSSLPHERTLRHEGGFQREPKRRSFSSSFSSMFSRKATGSPTQTDTPHHYSSAHSPLSSAPQRSPFMSDAYWQSCRLNRATLCAVLLDEWLKELSSLAREHGIRLASDGARDLSWNKTICL